MNTADTSDVLIVGNGAIAKTAALGLAQAGHSVTLLAPPTGRPAPIADWDTRVYALNHTAHSLLSGLKVWDALDQARVAPVESMAIAGDGGQPGLLGFDAYGAHVGTLAWIVEDRNLTQALDAALRFAPNVRQVSGRASAIDGRSDGIRVVLEQGGTLDAQLLIGADGAQSWVRNQCEIGYDYRSYHQRGVVANFSCTEPHHGTARQWFLGAEGIVALLPLPGNQVSLVWSAPDDLADTLLREGLDSLAKRLEGISDGVLGVLTPLQAGAIQAFPLNLIRPHALVAERVALIGDAAHQVHPLAGHGMNLGFGDVRDLLATLAAREDQRGIGDARVLARYARARQEDVLLMQVATDGLARLFGTEFEPLRVVRNLGLHLLDKLPFVKRKLISQALGK